MKFEPALPAPNTVLLSQMPMEAYMKAFATYKTRFSADRGPTRRVVRSQWLRLRHVLPDAARGRLRRRQAGGVPAPRLMGFICGFKARIHRLQPRGAEACRPEGVRVDVWDRGAGAGGLTFLPYYDGSGVVCGPSGLSPFAGGVDCAGEWMRRPLGRIHWAGTETAARSNGHMEGAVHSEVLDGHAGLGSFQSQFSGRVPIGEYMAYRHSM